MTSTSPPISAARQAVDTESQSIDAPLSAAAAFLILVVNDDEASHAATRSVLGSTDDMGFAHGAGYSPAMSAFRTAPGGRSRVSPSLGNWRRSGK
jgi:hypothetical protein